MELKTVDVVLSVKKLAKSSAIKEEVGGGGGQRRELNVSKSLRVFKVLLIVVEI